jgi:hypothetical protein
MASGRWDALLNESSWYVPAANLLAYRLDSTNPTTPIPAADQTLWSIGTAEGGQFTGQSVAKIVDATGAVTTSLATMDGRVTERGQVRITFTTPLGSTITGIGQVRRVNGVQAMEMQMITGGGGAYTTHWAYMLPLTEGTTPPDPVTDPGEQATYRSGRYRWLRGTSWRIEPQGRKRGRGRFTINGYRNGYFWGAGRERGSNESFQVLGSITPEGNLFLNAIDSDDFQLRLSQGGLLRGPRRQAQAKLRPYTNTPGQLGLPLQLRRIDDARAKDLITEGGEELAFNARSAAITANATTPAAPQETAAPLAWTGGGGLMGATSEWSGGDSILPAMGVISDPGASGLA